jgi:hypothetical protein
VTDRRKRTTADDLPVEALLGAYPRPMREIAERLRRIVKAAAPEATERVRAGWRLVGYDLPLERRRTAFFAWVWLQSEHVHLGFTRGSLMDDPGHVLQGTGVTKLARWLTFVPGDAIDASLLADLVREAARIAWLPRSLPWSIERVSEAPLIKRA